MRLLLAIVFVGSHLDAASLAVLTQNSVSFTSSCSAGAISANPCPPGASGAFGGLSGPNYQVNANTGVSQVDPLTYFPGEQQLSVSSDAEALYTCSPLAPCPPYVPLAGDANATQIISGYTTGPKRMGVIQLSVAVGFLHGIAPSLAVNDGVNTYDPLESAPAGSLSPCCGGFFDATLPVQLGGPFTVTASAVTGVGLSSCPPDSPDSCGFGESQNAALSFVFLDADGTPIPFTNIPEPGASVLCALGLLLLARVPTRRRTAATARSR